MPARRKSEPGAGSGARLVIVTCFGAGDPQFSGIRRLGREIAQHPRACTVEPPVGPSGVPSLDLGDATRLREVLVCGHGAPARARVGNGEEREITPERLSLPPRASLLLAACYQGREPVRRAWARGIGIPVVHVLGSTEETESALTTILLLHIREEGPESCIHWFGAWKSANDYLRPYFPMLREEYRRCGGAPLPVLELLEASADLRPVEAFVAIARRHPDYLRGLQG